MKIYGGISQSENRNSSRVLVDNILPQAKTIICNQICTRLCFSPPSNSPRCMDSLCIFDGSRENSFYLMPQNTSDGGADNGRCRCYLKTESVFTFQLQNHKRPAKVSIRGSLVFTFLTQRTEQPRGHSAAAQLVGRDARLSSSDTSCSPRCS